MKKLLTSLVVLLAMGLSASAQFAPETAAQRWGFKEDTLGESLQEFQSRYPQITLTNQFDSCKRSWPPPKHEKQNQKGQFGGFDRFEACVAAQREVIPRSVGCSHEAANVTNCALVTTILGVKTVAFYEFLDAKLYRIQIPFSNSDFENVISTANERYGKPSDTGTKEYQNSFGAHFSGRYAVWTRESDLIIVNEIRDKAHLGVLFSGEIMSALKFILPESEASVLLVVDSATTKEFAKPKNPSDF